MGRRSERVGDWLRASAGIDGYVGFAVGRSIFANAVRGFAADPPGYDLQHRIEEISARYRRFIAVYGSAARCRILPIDGDP